MSNTLMKTHLSIWLTQLILGPCKAVTMGRRQWKRHTYNSLLLGKFIKRFQSVSLIVSGSLN